MTPEDVLMLDDQNKDRPDCKQVLSVNHMDAQSASRSESEGGVSTERSCSTAKINYIPVDALQELLKFLDGQKCGLPVKKGYNRSIGLPSPLPGSLASSVPGSNLQQMKECDYLQPSSDPESSMTSNSDTSDSPVCGNNTYVSPSSNKQSYNFVGQNRKNSQTEAKKQRTAVKSNKGRKRLLPKDETPSSDPSEYKKYKNRQYARKSREKKSNEVKVLRERCFEQEAIIEIYKKTLSIFHAREAGLSPTWSMRQIQWFPSQAPRHNPPITVKCYLPDYDDKFFSELGNNAYGQLFQPTEVKPADVTDQPALESPETKPSISFANSSSPCDKYTLQTTISSTSYKVPTSMPCPSPPLPTKSAYLPSEKNSIQATQSTNPDMTDPLYSSPYVFVDQSQILNQAFIPHMKTETGLLRQLKEEEFHKLIAGMDQNQTADNGSTFNLIYLSALPENLKKASMDTLHTSCDGTNEVTQTAPDNAKQTSLNHQDGKFFLHTPDKVKKEQNSGVSPAPIVTNSPWMVSKKDCIPGIFSSKASEITAALLNGNSTRKAQMIKTQVSSGPPESNVTNLHNDTDTLSEEELKLLKMVHQFAKVPAVSQPFSSTQQNASRLTPTVVSSNGIPATTNIPNVSMLIDSFSSVPPITSHGPWHKANECKAIYTNSRVPSHQFRRKESEHFLKSHILHSLYAATTYPQTSSVAEQPFEVLAKTTADSLSCTTAIKNSVESISGGGNISNTHQPQKIAALAIARSSVTPKTCLTDSAVLTSLMSSVPDSETFIINEKPCQTSHAEQKPANSPNESSCYAHISTNTTGLGSLSSFVLENINVDLESLKSTLPDET